MAEEVAEGGSSLKDALGKKLGPLPAGAWILIAVAVFWYVSKRQKASASSANQATDPAGNVGVIDPATGYVYGTPQDQSALGGGSGSLGTSSESGSGGSTVAGSYADNQAWAVAAINYLVSIGVDATEANTAITQFLASQQLTSQQQADGNLVIQRLGAPPTPPEPGGHPGPIVNPPTGGGGSTYASNPPTGFTTTTVGANSIGAKWNSVTNATSYTMSWGRSPNASEGTVTVSTTAATATGLKPDTLYYLRVQASPAKDGAPFATLSKTTQKSGGGSSSGGSKGGGGSHDQAPYEHTVTRDGESYSSIAAEYHYKPGGIALWRYNYTSSPHSAAAKAEIKKRGPNLLYHGSTVYIPRS